MFQIWHLVIAYILIEGRQQKHLPSWCVTNVTDISDVRAELHIPTVLYSTDVADISNVGNVG